MDEIDDFTRSWYEQRFRDDFREKRKNEFQDFFASIMEKRHPQDFQRVRPWGRQGDQKNDGYLKSKRMLFQVYAPNEIKSAATIRKIEEDFTGALKHWKDHFNTWVFVHNSVEGLGPKILEKLLELGKVHPQITIYNWGREELRQVVFELAPAELASLFGPVPTRRDFIELEMADIKPILEHIGILPDPPEDDVRPVSPRKLERNMLSDFAATLLRTGMAREILVEKYFKRQMDPTLRDQIANSFHQKYSELRTRNLDPDAIFRDLQVFAGGEVRRTPRYECAVLTVLAYFFQKCDIFEDPEKEES